MKAVVGHRRPMRPEQDSEPATRRVYYFSEVADLWWSAKSRRPSQKDRREYRPRRSGNSPSTSTSQEDESEEDILECWDELMDTSTTDSLPFDYDLRVVCIYLTRFLLQNIFVTCPDKNLNDQTYVAVCVHRA